MAILTLSVPTRAGTVLTPAAATAEGDSFNNSGREFFYINNGGDSAVTVTFDAPGTCSFELADDDAHDLEIEIAAGTSRIIGTFSQTRFNDGHGRINVTYTAVTDVTVALLAAPSNA